MSEQLLVRAGSRRARLWELQHKCHCPVVGVCFDFAEIRRLVCGLLEFKHRPTDFDIHVIAVHECAANTPLAKRLNKELDKKYALHLSLAKPCRNQEELYAQWRRGVERGDVGGSMWAVFSHPACTEELLHRVYGEVHMLQHQIGAGHRVEQQVLLHLRRENAALGNELADIQKRFTRFRDERAGEVDALREQLAASRAEGAKHEGAAARLAVELESMRGAVADPHATLRITNRMKALETENGALKIQLADMEASIAALAADNRRLESALFRLASHTTDNMPEHGEAPLRGRTVLCVGGLGNVTPRYRNLVETRGGAFLHHDGGVEENIRRLDVVIAAADAVICQTGCVSHNAYWRVKEQCKRTGKPCAFVGNPSLSSFLQVLEGIVEETPAQTDTEGGSPADPFVMND